MTAVDISQFDTVDAWLLQNPTSDPFSTLVTFAYLPEPVAAAQQYTSRLCALVCEPGSELSRLLFLQAVSDPSVTVGAAAMLAAAFGVNPPAGVQPQPADCPSAVRAAAAVCSQRPGWTLPALLACARTGAGL